MHTCVEGKPCHDITAEIFMGVPAPSPRSFYTTVLSKKTIAIYNQKLVKSGLFNLSDNYTSLILPIWNYKQTSMFLYVLIN